MNIEIPDFLIEMSKQINEQDNRLTADPVWVVCYDEDVTCADGRGDKEVYLIHGDCSPTEIERYDDDGVIKYLLENDSEWVDEWCKNNSEEDEPFIFEEEFMLEFNEDELPENFEIVSMQTIRNKVKYCLTEADAIAFINRKQHDYKRLYTYVESMCFCPQMIELRNWIKGISNEC